MSPTSCPTDDGLPPLLKLPQELKLHIISYLVLDKSPNLACLRRTHKSFYNIIPKSDIRSKSTPFLLRSQLLDAELNHPYLLPHGRAPCYGCIAVIPSLYFHHLVGLDDYVLGGPRAYGRSCFSCGLMIRKRPEDEEWKREGKKQLALQPRPEEQRPFDPLSPSPGSGRARKRML